MAKKKDTDILLRIGTVQKFTHPRSLDSFTSEVDDGDGGVNVITSNLTIANRKFTTEKEARKSHRVVPNIFTLSRRKPFFIVNKKDGHDEAKVGKLIAHLRKNPLFFDINDPNEYDTVLKAPCGDKATCIHYYEDMRKTRKQKVNKFEENALIYNTIVEELESEESLRKALYLIGEVPAEGDKKEELMFTLTNAVAGEASVARQQFLDIYVHKGMSKVESDIRDTLMRAISHDVVSKSSGVYLAGTDRLGTTEKEAVAFLKGKPEVVEFIKTAIGSRSTFHEDKEQQKEVVEKAVATTASAEGEQEKEGLTKLLAAKFKKELSYSRPDVAMRNKTIEESIVTYNEKLAELDVPESVPITLEGLKEELAKNS